MNLWMRMIYFFCFWRFRSSLGFFEEARTPFRTWPSDLDMNMHMNNGIYLSIMDIGRFDLVFRTGLAQVLKKNKWYPVVASQMIRYKRSLGLFEKFEIHSRLLGWDDRFFYIQQKFVSKKGTVAMAVVKGAFLKKGEKGILPPQKLAEALELLESPPEIPDWVHGWEQSEKNFWQEQD